MIAKTLLVIFFLALAMALSAQKNDSEHFNYVLENYYKPLTIKANVIVLYRNDGSGNFDLNDIEQKELLEDYMEKINSIYANLTLPEDGEKCEYLSEFIYRDALVRFEFNYIKIKNSYAWDYLNSGSDPDNKKYGGFTPTENWYIKSLDDSISNSSNIPKGINIYMTTNGKKFDEIYNSKGAKFDITTAAAAQLPTDSNLKRSSQAHMPNRFLKYLRHRYEITKLENKPWEVIRNWHLDDAKGMAHEVGHNFGLYHQNKCPNALMKQGIRKDKYFIPPNEIKKIHWNLTRTNLMQLVTEDSHYGVTWNIDKDTIWNQPRRFYNDFEIAKDVTLTIADSIILPPKSFIKLNKNSKIIIEGKGKLVDAYGKEFINFNKHKTSSIIRKP